MVGFLVAHLSGNLLVFAGPEAMNTYAEKLRDFLPVLWVLRIGLVVMVALHICSAVALTRRNRGARKNQYRSRSWQTTTWASRSMALTGLVILSFFLYHLAHLTFRWTHPEFANLGPYDVYEMLLISFRSPVLTGFYCVSIILLMMHLSHGVTSFFQTLGMSHRQYKGLVNSIGPVLSTALGLGFLSIPAAILLGFVR